MNANVHAGRPRRLHAPAARHARVPSRARPVGAAPPASVPLAHGATAVDAVRGESLGIGLILFVTLALFVLVALVGTLFGVNWRAWLPGAEGERSLLAAATRAAHSVLPML